MPYFSKLSVDKVWPLIQKDEELMRYFPKYSEKQLPSRDYFYCVLSSVRPAETKTLLEEALKNRFMYKDTENGESIKISSKWLKELQEVVDLKSKFLVMISAATRGRAFQLLKTKTKQSTKRKPSKKYKANLAMLTINAGKSKEKLEESKERIGPNIENMQVDSARK